MESIIQFANSKRIKAGWIYIKEGSTRLVVN